MGNVVLAKLIEAVQKALRDEININVYCQVDSQNFAFMDQIRSQGISRFRRKSGEWNSDKGCTRKLVLPENWFYVQTDHNPGEPRGEEYEEFKKELKPCPQSTLVTPTEDKPTIDNVIDIQRYGDMLRLLCVTLYMLRFINNLKKKRDKVNLFLAKYLSGAEMKAAR